MRTDNENRQFLKELENAIRTNEELLKRTRDTAARLTAKLEASIAHDLKFEELPSAIPGGKGTE